MIVAIYGLTSMLGLGFDARPDNALIKLSRPQAFVAILLVCWSHDRRESKMAPK